MGRRVQETISPGSVHTLQGIIHELYCCETVFQLLILPQLAAAVDFQHDVLC